jgi:putative hemolysin
MSGGGGLGTDNLLLATGVVSICIFMVAAFASSEASILAANRLRIQQLAARGSKPAKAFCELRDNEDKMFATILAVENMFIIFAASFGVSSAERILGKDHHIMLGGVTLLTLTLVPFLLEFLIVLFGEITPKTYAARHATRMALLISRPLNVVVKLLYPLIRFAFVIPSRLLIGLLDRIFGNKEISPSITEEELLLIIDRSSQEGVLDDDERNLLRSVFEFGDTRVSEVMTSRTHIEAFSMEDTVTDALPQMMESGHSRFPIYGDSIDDIKGLVHLKELIRLNYHGSIKSNMRLKQFVRPTLFIPENKRIIQLLQMMQVHRLRTVIVADEYGGTEGLITFNDLMREVFDDVKATANENVDIQKTGHDSYLIQAQTSIYDLSEELNLVLPDGKYQTLAGFVLEQLGHIPQVGESFIYKSWRLTVKGVTGPKIEVIELHKTIQTTPLKPQPNGGKTQPLNTQIIDNPPTSDSPWEEVV